MQQKKLNFTVYTSKIPRELLEKAYLEIQAKKAQRSESK